MHSLEGSDGWIQSCNAQAAVDGGYQVIVAIGMSHQASDAVHLLPMLQRIEAKSGQLPDALIADATYSSTPNLEVCEDRQLNAYISTSR
jgi:hypothetical protein